MGRKCRASHAEVVKIESRDGQTQYQLGASKYNKAFAYIVGQIVRVDNYDPSPLIECSGGIHFFITRREAVEY